MTPICEHGLPVFHCSECRNLSWTEAAMRRAAKNKREGKQNYGAPGEGGRKPDEEKEHE